MIDCFYPFVSRTFHHFQPIFQELAKAIEDDPAHGTMDADIARAIKAQQLLKLKDRPLDEERVLLLPVLSEVPMPEDTTPYPRSSGKPFRKSVYRGLFTHPKSVRRRRGKGARLPQTIKDLIAAGLPSDAEESSFTIIPAELPPVSATEDLFNTAVRTLALSASKDHQEIASALDKFVLPDVRKSCQDRVPHLISNIITELSSKQRRSKSASRQLYGQGIAILEKYCSIGDRALTYDEYRGALPWSALHFALVTLTGAVELEDKVVAGLVAMISAMARASLYTRLYLSPTLNVSRAARSAREGLKAALVHVYVASLLLIGRMAHDRETSKLRRTSDTSLYGIATLAPRIGYLYDTESLVMRAVEKLRLAGKLQDGRSSRELPRDARKVPQVLRDLIFMQRKIQHMSGLLYHNDLRPLLEPVDSAFYDHEGADTKECYSDTRTDLLDSISNWHHKEGQPPLYWYSGPPGSGKTTVVRTVAKKLDDNDCLGASFSFDPLHPDRNHGRRFFPTIAFQLASKLPDWHQYLGALIRTRPELATGSLDMQCEYLILKPLARERITNMHLTSDQQLTIVIDSLDDCCTPDAERILQLLFSAKLRFLVTTRPKHNLRPMLRTIDVVAAVPALNHRSDMASQRDILTYTKHKMDEFRTEYNTQHRGSGGALLPFNWLSDGLLNNIATLATPLFLTIDTIARMLREPTWDLGPQARIRYLLYNMSRGETALNEVYLQVLQRFRANGPPDNGSSSAGEAGLKQFRAIMGPVTSLLTPLNARELAALVFSDGDEELTIRACLRRLHPVVHVPTSPDAPIRLFHASFREFLIRKGTPKAFRIDEKQAHADMASCCCRLLSEELHPDMVRVKTPGISRSEISDKQVASHLRPALQYAALCWVKHLRASGSLIRDDDEFHRFLQSKFIVWLEVLSLMSKMSEAKHLLLQLRAAVDLRLGYQALKLVHDGKRFVSLFGEIISQHPLQGYHSGLLFAPETSLIRDARQTADCPTLVAKPPTVEKTWDEHLQTRACRGARFTRLLCTSADGQMALSRSDGVVDVWDPVLSHNFFESDQRIGPGLDAAAFSGEGRLATSSRAGIQVWDLTFGTCLLAVKDEGAVTTSMAFAPVKDVRDSLSVTRSRSAKMYDLRTGACIHTYEYGKEAAYKALLSNKGTYLAVQSASAVSVYRWERAQRPRSKLSVKVSKKMREFLAFDFSLDETLLGVASRASVQIWSVQTGTCLWEHGLGYATSRAGFVKSIVLSQRLVAMAMTGGDVVVCDFLQPGGGVLRPLGEAGAVIGLAVMPQDDALVTLIEVAVLGTAMRLWDPSSMTASASASASALISQQLAQPMMGEMRFTYGGQGLVQASLESANIKVTNVAGEVVHFEEVANFAVSNVKPRLAVARPVSGGGISIFETETLTSKMIVAEGYCCTEMTVMDFSTDGDRLAVAVGTGTDKPGIVRFVVQLWNVTNGLCEMRVTQPDRVLLIAASAGGTPSPSHSPRVALAAWNQTSSHNVISIYDVASSHRDPVQVRGVAATAICFLDRARLLAVLPGWNTKLLDASMGTVVRDIRLAPPGPCYISVDHLSLDARMLDSPHDGGQEAQHDGHDGQQGQHGQEDATLLADRYYMSPDGGWIMKGQEEVIWIPPDYRGPFSAVSDWHMAIGCLSGKTLRFQFRDVSPQEKEGSSSHVNKWGLSTCQVKHSPVWKLF